jgi:hypothetical protein
MGTGGCSRRKVTLAEYQKRVGNGVLRVEENVIYNKYTFIAPTHTISECYEIVFAESDRLEISEGKSLILEGHFNILVTTLNFNRIKNFGTFTTNSESKIDFGRITSDENAEPEVTTGIGIFNKETGTIKQAGIVNFETIFSGSENVYFSCGILNKNSYTQIGEIEINEIIYSFGILNHKIYQQTGAVTIQTIDDYGYGISNYYLEILGESNYSQLGDIVIKQIFSTNSEQAGGIVNCSNYDQKGDITMDKLEATNGNVYGFKHDSTSPSNQPIYNQEGNITIDTFIGSELGPIHTAYFIYLFLADNIYNQYGKIVLKNQLANSVFAYLEYGRYNVLENASIDLENGINDGTYGFYIYESIVKNDGIVNLGIQNIPLTAPYYDEWEEAVIPTESDIFTGEGVYVGYPI